MMNARRLLHPELAYAELLVFPTMATAAVEPSFPSFLQCLTMQTGRILRSLGSSQLDLLSGLGSFKAQNLTAEAQLNM